MLSFIQKIIITKIKKRCHYFHILNIRAVQCCHNSDYKYS